MNLKEIHIGKMIQTAMKESGIEMERACAFLKKNEEELNKMFLSETLDTGDLLRWSKLLKYDFFRIYSQHLILYSPPSAEKPNSENAEKSKLPRFRKNIYTQEMINFILNLIETKQKTKNEIIEEYRIPKTTLYKWINKHKK